MTPPSPEPGVGLGPPPEVGAAAYGDRLPAKDVPSCPLCGIEGQELYRGLRDRFHDVPGRWSFLRCPRCGHVWLSPRPLPAALDQLYAPYHAADASATTPAPADPLAWPARRGLLYTAGYVHAARGGGERALGWALRHLPPFRRALERDIMGLTGPATGRLLDVGCGTGTFLYLMRALGWEVLGLEANAQAVHVARARYGLPVIEAPLDEALLPAESFDAITMNHVIEHLPDPRGALGRCRAALRPGGRLLVRTPNLKSRGHRVFGESWMHLDPPRHFHLFSPETLRGLVEGVGLRVKALRTSAARADRAFDVSLSIRRSGGALLDPAYRPSPRARFFRLREGLAVGAGLPVGEELALEAVRP